MLQSLLHIRRAQINPSDDTRNPRIPFRQPQQKFRFRFRLIRLHRDRRIDAIRIEYRGQISRQKIAPDRRHILVDPGVPHRIEPPKVLMSVDDHRLSVAMYEKNYDRSRKCTSLCPRNVAAAVSAVMSRCGDASISYPTMNFWTVAERSSGG